MNEARLDRVRAEIEAPLLVSNAVDVLYLTGLHSSNAALLVEPDGARLFTDFRYVQKARELGIEAVVGAPRHLLGARRARRRPDRVPGGVADLRPVRDARGERLRARPATGADGRDPRRQGRRGAGGDQPRYRDHQRVLRAAGRADLRRPDREGARLVVRVADARARGGRGRIPGDRRGRPGRRAAARQHERPGDRARPDGRRRRGGQARRLLLGLHAHVLDRRPAGRAGALVRRLPARAAGGARGGTPGRGRPRGGRRSHAT